MCQTTVKPFSSDSLPELIRFISFLNLAERECCHASHVALNAFSGKKYKKNEMTFVDFYLQGLKKCQPNRWYK